jgi:flagellar P-ring protein precursor FlgI
VQRGVPTAGRISNGAIVEREIPFTFGNQQRLRLALRNPDMTTARRIAAAVNRAVGNNTAVATDPGTVVLNTAGRDVPALVAQIETLTVTPDQVARVIIDEATGTIVMGANVRISTVAIAQGNLTVRVTEQPQVVQPNAFGQGQTAVVPRTQIEVDDQRERRLGILPDAVTLDELVRGLNGLGVGPRDMISILQAIRAAGALQAELEVR